MKSGFLALGGIIGAIAASSCCILPMLGAGISILGGTLSWIEGLRPYMAGFTLLALSLAWIFHIREARKEKTNNDCCNTEMASCSCPPQKNKTGKNTYLLAVATLFAIGVMGYPYIAVAFSNSGHSSGMTTEKDTLKKDTLRSRTYQPQVLKFSVKGMTCGGCEEMIKSKVKKVNGVVNVSASYKTGNVEVEATERTNPELIKRAIEDARYKVLKVESPAKEQ